MHNQGSHEIRQQPRVCWLLRAQNFYAVYAIQHSSVIVTSQSIELLQNQIAYGEDNQNAKDWGCVDIKRKINLLYW